MKTFLKSIFFVFLGFCLANLKVIFNYFGITFSSPSSNFPTTFLGSWISFGLTVFSFLITFPTSFAIYYLWFITISRGQVPYFIFRLSNGFKRFPFKYVRPKINFKKESTKEELLKVKILNKVLYTFNGYLKEISILSEDTDKISEPKQFNIYAYNFDRDYFSDIFECFVKNDNLIMFNNLEQNKLEQQLQHDCYNILELWKPEISNKLSGGIAFVIQTAIITRYLKHKLSREQAETIWLSVYLFYVDNPSLVQKTFSAKEVETFSRLLSIFFLEKADLDQFIDSLFLLGDNPNGSLIGNLFIDSVVK